MMITLLKRAGVLALAVMLTMGVMSTSAFAKNNTDEWFSYSILESTIGRYTASREKEDDSATYLYLTQVPFNYIDCQVYGYMPIDSIGHMSWQDKTIGGYVRIPTGKWLIKNDVYNPGGRAAKLKFSRYLLDGTVAGYWSPDSLGSYPYAN